MIATFIFVSMGLVALLCLLVLAKGRAGSTGNVEQLTGQLRPVDVDAFRNLMDLHEEQYLRANLPGGEFRRVQRERMLAAIGYISCAAHNAAILMRIGDAARRSPDPATAAAAEKLVDTAIRLRLSAFHALAKLYLALILPLPRISPVRLAEGYEQMTRLVVMLSVFQQKPQDVAAAL